MYHTILVPLDGSTLSEQAIPMACRVAQHNNAVLHLVHVHTLGDFVHVEGLPVIDEQLRTLGRVHEQSYLEQIRERIMAYNSLQVVIANPDVEGTLASTLTHYAAKAGCDLVVLATHGHGGLERMWLGSVTDALIRLTHLPLLLVRPREDVPSEPTAEVSHILIPLDGSAFAESILDPAVAFGAVFGARYTLLHVVEPLMLLQPDPFMLSLVADPDDTQRRQAQAAQYLETIAGRHRLEKQTISTQTVIASSVAPMILDFAERTPRTVITLATHGQRGLQRLLLGSVADKVVRGATTPILLFRPSQASR
jgi:nucleotide-binding universal stress UspA family protein